MALFEELNREGITTLVTHEADIARHETRVRFHDGRIVSDQPTPQTEHASIQKTCSPRRTKVSHVTA